MARSHTMTPARRAALKKAQAASARKRRGKGKGKLAAANRKTDSKGKISTRRKIIAGALYAAYVGYYGYSINKNIQGIRKIQKENKRRKQYEAQDAYLRKMRYGQNTNVRSTRGASVPLQRALPTRVRALTR